MVGSSHDDSHVACLNGQSLYGVKRAWGVCNGTTPYAKCTALNLLQSAISSGMCSFLVMCVCVRV